MLNLNQNIYRCLLPNLLEIQRISFCWFLEKGLLQEIENFAAIRDYSGELELSLSAKQYKIKRPKYSLTEAKRRDTTYSIRLYIVAKLNYLATSESKKGEVFLGDIPLMTNAGTFLVNGIERIIINQIVRSPGIYYKREAGKQNSYVYTASLISNRGTWVKFEIDKMNLCMLKSTKQKSYPALCS